MKIAYSHLKELVPALAPAQELEPIFAQMGLPLESLSEVSAPTEGVLLVAVRSAQPIEGTQLTKIVFDAGPHGEQTIASGAPNAVGLPAGTMLALVSPGTSIGGMTYGVRQLQGVESWGMAASYKELELGESSAGLILLPAQTAPAGTPLAQLWPSDVVLDIEVTPNRADVLSALGLARDLAAFLRLELVPPAIVPAQPQQGQIAVSLPEKGVVLERDPSKTLRFACDHFVARSVQGVCNGPAPLWMQRRLTLAGLRCIDLIVDTSNYVMLELGQPTALYDRREVRHDQLVVAFGLRQGEMVKDLLGQTHTVSGEDVVILDGQHAEVPSVAQALSNAGEPTPAQGVLGIAGVIGGEHGHVRADTSDVVIESAHFDPVLLRRTSTRLGLKTDAAYRFERGVDPLLAPKAADRVAALLAEYGGGIPEAGATIAGEPRLPASISVCPQQVRDLLGMAIETAEMVDILQRLGCSVSPCAEAQGTATDQVAAGQECLSVTPPSWRIDLNIWQDVAEEVARLHGFVHLPETLPTLRVHSSNLGASAESDKRRQVRGQLSGLGFQEVVTYTFTSQEEAQKAGAEAPSVRLQNPMTHERTAMRTALYPSLLKAAQPYGKSERVMLFELGRIFPQSGEAERLGVLMRGDLAAATYQAGIKGGFSVFKGLLEAFAHNMGAHFELRQLTAAAAPAALHPGIVGEVLWNGQSIGFMGALHPQVAAAFELKGETFIFEVSLPLPSRTWAFHDPSRSPAAWRDLAVIAPQDVSYGQIADLLRKAGGALLESIEPFDVYVGEQVGPDKRSVAVRMVYRGQKTLTDEELDPVFLGQIEAVKAAGWAIRERE